MMVSTTHTVWMQAQACIHHPVCVAVMRYETCLLLKVTLDHAVSMQAEACIEILECGEAVAVGNRVCSDFAGPA